jgi:hypothetical protein
VPWQNHLRQIDPARHALAQLADVLSAEQLVQLMHGESADSSRDPGIPTTQSSNATHQNVAGDFRAVGQREQDEGACTPPSVVRASELLGPAADAAMILLATLCSAARHRSPEGGAWHRLMRHATCQYLFALSNVCRSARFCVSIWVRLRAGLFTICVLHRLHAMPPSAAWGIIPRRPRRSHLRIYTAIFILIVACGL